MAGSHVEMDSLYPAKQGWIEKRGGMNTSYKPRYFELIGPHLVYYKTEGGNATGKIDLCNITQITPIDQNIGTFDYRFTLNLLEPGKREWTLGFPSAVNMLGWLAPITKAMRNHCTHGYKILELDTLEEHQRRKNVKRKSSIMQMLRP